MSEQIEKCEECGMTENVVLHHVSYEPEVTQKLCRSCHTKAHTHGKIPKRPMNFIAQFTREHLKPILISDVVKARLMALAGKLQAEKGKRQTVEDAIVFLLDEHEGKKE